MTDRDIVEGEVLQKVADGLGEGFNLGTATRLATTQYLPLELAGKNLTDEQWGKLFAYVNYLQITLQSLIEIVESGMVEASAIVFTQVYGPNGETRNATIRRATGLRAATELENIIEFYKERGFSESYDLATGKQAMADAGIPAGTQLPENVKIINKVQKFTTTKGKSYLRLGFGSQSVNLWQEQVPVSFYQDFPGWEDDPEKKEYGNHGLNFVLVDRDGKYWKALKVGETIEEVTP